MKILVSILLFPLLLPAQVMTDSTNVILPATGEVIRFVTTHQATTYSDGDSIRFRSTVTKKLGLVSPLSFPVSSASQTALNLKANLASPTFTGTVTLPASTSLTTPVIGAATGTSLAVTGAITSSGAGIGYTSGNGGTVTQITNKSTGVTLNKLAGDITMINSALAAATIVSFTLTNSTIAATDIIHVQHNATGTFGAYTITGRSAAGSAVISVRNNTAGSLSEAIVIKFIIIKSVIN